jgi:DNA-binding transcriptional ArsR family regulator
MSDTYVPITLEEDTQEIDDSLDIEGSRRLVSEPRDLSIRELFTQEQDGDLMLQPDFQRYYVFDDAKASRLIESVLMSVPLPLIYLAEEPDAKFSVIDGQQRLTSFFRFLGNELRLRNLSILKEYSKMSFKDLPEDMQRNFRNSAIRCIIIKRESHPDIRFEIFERLNTGSVRLNDQELRNCIYRGRFNTLLAKLAEDPNWLLLLRRSEPDKRMVDREMILRFFALFLDFNHYKPPMKRFLNQAIETRRHMSEAEAHRLNEVFRQAVQNTKSVFGQKAFVRYEPGHEENPNGSWSSERRLNMALFDTIMLGFARYEQRDIVPYGNAIREALLDLMATNREFNDAITLGTSERHRLLARIDIWNNRLREVLSNPRSEPRLYSPELRQELFERDPTCSICRQRITLVDDAAVDHIVPYSHGGTTNLSNARLAHRYCNSARGNRT